MIHIGVVIADRGSAIVSVEHDDAARLVTGIERHPFDLSTVAERVRELAPDHRVIVDADGLGNALWAVLGRPEDAEHWHLYNGRGVERQALVDELLVAVEEDRFHFAAGLAEQSAMSKALGSYRRQVRDDGLIGSELVVALLLALIPLVPVVERDWWMAWGPSPFDPSPNRELDGVSVGGVTIHAAPDGTLVGIVQPQEPSDV